MPYLKSIVQAKFHIPQLPSDFVIRHTLNDKLNKVSESSLILLVSAPTGYGKSILISAWLQKTKPDFAWLSLSDRENDFPRFLLYFVSAIQQKVEAFGQDILDLCSAPEMPPTDIFVDATLNSLADFKKTFYLILDDIHLIRNKQIFDYIAKLFTYGQQNFRLILISRRDPALPLTVWRGKKILTDIRARDLQFDRAETNAFFTKALDYLPNETTLKTIEKITDGWVAGLRMLILALGEKVQIAEKIEDLDFQNSHIFYQLITTVLQNQPETNQSFLLKLSLLKEFNSGLFAALCLPSSNKEKVEPVFDKFINDITGSNLFIIALDDKHNWYRFHHLFTERLQEILLEKFTFLELNRLRTKAADWFAEHGLMHEAIEQYLLAEQTERAVHTFCQLKNKLLSEAQWQSLESVFSLFPTKLVENHSILLLTKAWLLIYKGNIPEMLQQIESIEKLIISEVCDDSSRANSLGELNTLRAWDCYIFNIDICACLQHCNDAIKLIDVENPYALGLAWIFYGGAMQAMKNSKEAKFNIYEALSNTTNVNLKAQLFLTICYIEWLDGDLINVITTASQLGKLGNENRNLEAIANGKYFSGMANYFLNNLENACIDFNKVYKLRYHTLQVHSFFGATGLAFSLSELGKTKDYKLIIQYLEDSAIERGGPLYVNIAKLIAAEISWKIEKNPAALKRAKESDHKPFIPLTNIFSPQLSQAKILATDTDSSSWHLSLTILNDVISFLEQHNNVNFLIQAYIIKSFVLHKLGEKDKACSLINKALNLSEPRGFIHPYLELGDTMIDILSVCKSRGYHIKYLESVLNTLNNAKPGNNDVILTSRETQILQLLEGNLSNKEVGNKLFISEKTVKRHLANIYKKLGAGSRREALVKAKEMELV